MSSVPYIFSPIIDRPALHWPTGGKVAVYVAINIEHFEAGKPSTSIFAGTVHLEPDPLNHGWRDYGNRVGIWRMIELFDRLHLPASALINADVVTHYPEVIEAARERDWAFVAHGRNNSSWHSGFSEADERAELDHVISTVQAAAGKPILGWMGPGLTETYNTPALLKARGLSYVLDWCADDQPFPLTTPGMWSVPYSVELNDIMLFTQHGFTGKNFVQIVKDQYTQLRHDSEVSGRVMALALHPFVIGQAFRLSYLYEALAWLKEQPDIWFTTSDDIARHMMHNANSIAGGNSRLSPVNP